MAGKSKIQPMSRLLFDTSGLTTSYQTLSASGFSNDVQILRVVNDSDQDIDISYDGTTDNDFCRAGDSFELLFGAAKEGDQGALSAGTQVYVKGAAAGTGLIYASAYGQRR